MYTVIFRLFIAATDLFISEVSMHRKHLVQLDIITKSVLELLRFGLIPFKKMWRGEVI